MIFLLCSYHTKSLKSSLRLPSPSRRQSHIPQPVKKDALPSPTNKPLPQIPVATFISRSPQQRRSLLDATEKPLCRSVSPGTVEDWPALSPIKSQKPQEMAPSTDMVSAPLPLQSSPGENVIEHMRKLDLDNENSIKLSNAPSTASLSKAQPQNYTPKINATYVARENSRAPNDDKATDSKFLDPRPAPETPRAAKQDRTSVFSSINRTSSLPGLIILKTRRNSKPIMGRSTADSLAQDQPLNSSIPKPSFITSVDSIKDFGSSRRGSIRRKPLPGSALPRPLRSVTDTGSPRMTSSQSSPKVIHLKRAQGQVADLWQKQNGAPQKSPKFELETDSATPFSNEDPPKCDFYPAGGLSLGSTCAVQTPRSSSLPIPAKGEPEPVVSATTMMSTWMQPSICDDKEGERKISISSSTTIKKEPASSPSLSCLRTPVRGTSFRETVPSNNHDSDEDLSPVRNFKFPAAIPAEEEVDDSRSDVTQVTSMSSTSKAGTIYARDELGGYRLKPVSKTNPKNGPHVRIQDSADHLLLSDDQLAQVEAKRAAYQRKFSHNVVNKNAVGIVPELQSLRYASNGYAHPKSTNDEQHKMDGQVEVSSKKHSARLAPPVTASIGALSHSLTGWPILMSKIAPFAEVDSPQSDSSSAKRRSASESDLCGPLGMTVQDGPGPAYNTSPASAYTLRTALHNGPEGPPTVSRTGSARDKVSKSRSSLPNIANALSNRNRTIFPPRMSSKASEISPLHGLRKQTSALMGSYVDQRADFSRPKAPIGHANGNTQHNITRTPTSPTSQLKHIQTYNTSLRHLNAHQNLQFENDLPSSPIAIPGTVPTGKAKMMSTMRGLMHKISKEGGMIQSDSKASIVYNSSARRGSDTDKYKSSPLVLRSLDEPEPSTVSSANSNGVDKATNVHANAKAKRTLGLSRLAHGHSIKTASHAHPASKSSMNDEVSAPPPPFMTSALEPLEIRDATALAFSLLDKARDGNGNGNAQKAEYVELARALVSIVTLARDAEKSMEEAKSAATRAEMECVRTRQAIVGVSEVVRKVVGGKARAEGNGEGEDT